MVTHIWKPDGFGSLEEKVDVVRVTKMETGCFKLCLVKVENLPLLNHFGSKKRSKLG